MDLHEQLKKLFPDHIPTEDTSSVEEVQHELYIQKEPMICKYEKRNGKPTTIISGYDGEPNDFKILAKEIKTKFAVGGSIKDGEIVLQGDYREKIMDFLKDKGFKTKRVGG